MVVKELKEKISVPEGITVNVNGKHIEMNSSKGKILREFKDYRVKMELVGNEIIVSGAPFNNNTKKIVNTVIAHIKNMIKGLTKGYKSELKVVYSHFPMNVQVEKNLVSIKNFLGEKFPRKAKIVGNTKVEIKGQNIFVSGIDKDAVGQTAANLELKTKIRGKDIRRFQDGIYLISRGNME
jgi:large subunit ribosomal protein L6